mgnify:CR=1 FL=1
MQSLCALGIPTVIGELGYWSSIDLALDKVDTVFLLSSPSPEMLELHKGLIDRAVKLGVRKIVRLSAEPAGSGAKMGLYDLYEQADNYLKQSGLAYVILRPHYFMQNIETMHAYFIKENNMFAQFLGDARIPMVDTRDIATASFCCLTSDDFNNQIHYITGPRSISFSDVANALSTSLNRDIQYVPLSFEDQSSGFKTAGLPDWTIDTVMTIFQSWSDSVVCDVSPDFEKITKTKAIDINQWASDYSGCF